MSFGDLGQFKRAIAAHENDACTAGIKWFDRRNSDAVFVAKTGRFNHVYAEVQDAAHAGIAANEPAICFIRSFCIL